MTENELFEADYLAAFPDSGGIDNIRYLIDIGLAQIPFAIWQQQRKRHEAEVAELVAAAKDIRTANTQHSLIRVSDALTRLDAAIAKFDAKGRS